MGPLNEAQKLLVLKEEVKPGYFTGKPGVIEVVHRLVDNRIQGAIPAKEVKIGTCRKTVMWVEGCHTFVNWHLLFRLGRHAHWPPDNRCKEVRAVPHSPQL